jgi:hypothetical protein
MVVSAATVTDLCRAKAIAATLVQELVKLKGASQSLPKLARRIKRSSAKDSAIDAMKGLGFLGSLHDSVFDSVSHSEIMSSPLQFARKIKDLVRGKTRRQTIVMQINAAL